MANKRLVFETDLQKYEAATKALGSGGSGQVFGATGADGEPYAIKVLAPELATTSKLKRFKNELAFGRKVRHDHIVPVLDSGAVELGGATTPFFVMPRYAASLRSLIQDGMSPDRALALFRGVIAGLEVAHGRSVWHRDVKPENVLYDEASDRLLLADFGIAHFEEEDLWTAVATRNAERLANFAYAAPEQRQEGAKVDHRADIYAAGLILNEMITGELPHGTHFRLVQAVSGRHAYVDTVVERMLRRAPHERFDSMGDVRHHLQLLGTGSGLSKARSVASTVSATVEKDRLFHSHEGAATVRRQVIEIWEYVEAVLKQIANEQHVLGLEFEREGDLLVLRTKRTSAKIHWYQQFSNTLDHARLTIWTYKWRLLLPSQTSHWSSVEPKQMSEIPFFPVPDREHGGYKISAEADVILTEVRRLESQINNTVNRIAALKRMANDPQRATALTGLLAESAS